MTSVIISVNLIIFMFVEVSCLYYIIVFLFVCFFLMHIIFIVIIWYLKFLLNIQYFWTSSKCFNPIMDELCVFKIHTFLVCCSFLNFNRNYLCFFLYQWSRFLLLFMKLNVCVVRNILKNMDFFLFFSF